MDGEDPCMGFFCEFMLSLHLKGHSEKKVSSDIPKKSIKNRLYSQNAFERGKKNSSITFHARAVSEIKLATSKTKTHYKITIYHIIADVRKLC